MEKTIEILTKKEISQMLRISLRAIEHLVVTNQIPYSRLGKRSVRFSKTRVVEWFQEREGVEYRLNRK